MTDLTANIKPVKSDFEDSPLAPSIADPVLYSDGKPYGNPKHANRLSLDLSLPAVEDKPRDTPYPYTEDTDHYPKTPSPDTCYSTQTESASYLHKLNTDLGTNVNPANLHDELFKKKVIFEEKNNLISQLEISNINLDFKVTKIEQESSNLVKQKLELTKQFNINNIKNVDHIPSSIKDKYKNAYLSITNNNKDITSSINNIKNQLDFMQNTKINLLKDINNNIKYISNLKHNQILLAKEIRDIEKITGNIARTPLN